MTTAYKKKYKKNKNKMQLQTKTTGSSFIKKMQNTLSKSLFEASRDVIIHINSIPLVSNKIMSPMLFKCQHFIRQ